jgi:hypothetical protein
MDFDLCYYLYLSADFYTMDLFSPKLLFVRRMDDEDICGRKNQEALRAKPWDRQTTNTLDSLKHCEPERTQKKRPEHDPMRYSPHIYVAHRLLEKVHKPYRTD